MATVAGTQGNLIDRLIALVELDYDAIEAYEAAIDRLDDENFRANMRGFLLDHQRHVQELSEVIRELGGVPPTGGDLKRVLTKGKVVIAQIAGDRGILAAMKTNEDDTNTAYEHAVSHADTPQHIMTLLHRNLSDERRNRAWIQAQRSGAQRSPLSPV